MSPGNQEQERFKRLHDRQLSDRDPLVKQRNFQRNSAQKERKARKPYSLAKMWSDIPHVTIVIFAILGVIFGRAFDARDEIQKLAR